MTGDDLHRLSSLSGLSVLSSMPKEGYPRQNGLAVALRELGRIERTLFILDWLQSVELRRRVHAGLNKRVGKDSCKKPQKQA